MFLKCFLWLIKQSINVRLICITIVDNNEIKIKIFQIKTLRSHKILVKEIQIITNLDVMRKYHDKCI